MGHGTGNSKPYRIATFVFLHVAWYGRILEASVRPHIIVITITITIVGFQYETNMIIRSRVIMICQSEMKFSRSIAGGVIQGGQYSGMPHGRSVNVPN